MTVAVLKEYLPLLKLVKSLNAKDTKALIPYLSDGALEALCGTVGACMHSDTLSKKRRTELRHKLRHKKAVLRALAQLPASAPREKKTALLQQAGGFPGLGLLVSAAVPLITSLISRATRKK
jgi:hypothetical protein